MMTQCLAVMSWRVFKHGRFIGYVVAYTQYEAWQKARDKYGSDLRIEKLFQFGPIVQSGLGRGPFTAETGVQIPIGSLRLGSPTAGGERLRISTVWVRIPP